MNEFFIIIIALFVGAASSALVIFFLKKKGPEAKDNGIFMLQTQINELARTMDSRLGESTKAIQTHFGQSFAIIKDVTEGLAKLGQTNKEVLNFTEQLKSLQDILKNPKQRGVLGEYYLETVLKNVMPPGAYQMQYKFEDGEIVDAVIFLDKNKILSIDSKFSLENYNRILETNNKEERERLEKVFKQDLKNRIDETAKYIRPKEETMDFAFMFIPSEAIYYDLLINQVGAVKTSTRDLIEYAFKDKHVIIVSPTSFMAYLQTVLQGLRALKIEESAKEIRKRVEELGRHIKNYEEFVAKLGNHLSSTVNAYNASYKELGKIDKDVLKITGAAPGLEPLAVDKPQILE
ncbi:MAG: DNA recombination protein RmuC [Patescibacteria group bacterium]